MIKESFFRQKALEHYRQNQVPRIMPKFIPSRTIFSYWILFLILIAVGLIIWSYNPPHFEQETGIIQNVSANSLSSYGIPANRQQAQTRTILLLPAQLSSQLQTGRLVQVQLENIHHPVSGTIEHIDRTSLMPDEARQRYHLSDQAIANIPQPAFVALIDFGATMISPGYNGQTVTAYVQVETQNTLSLFFTSLITKGGWQSI